eukprot:5035140-Karenia_brevis.AAC.1
MLACVAKLRPEPCVERQHPATGQRTRYLPAVADVGGTAGWLWGAVLAVLEFSPCCVLGPCWFDACTCCDRCLTVGLSAGCGAGGAAAGAWCAAA